MVDDGKQNGKCSKVVWSRLNQRQLQSELAVLGYQTAAADVCCQAARCSENSACRCDQGQADLKSLKYVGARKTGFGYQGNIIHKAFER